ncbi:MAG: GIY-YIG nuclease family protein [Deltaproteobacteria bacterium]|nr:GIY-YIG nuclease family protein [Deltaproteobacteria bacterium]
MSYFVYILKSLKKGTYYTGSTQDLSERIERHNHGRSKYTKTKRPWELVYSEKFPDRSHAINREKQIKARKSKKFIENLVERSRQT